jgi:hypothetical protein
MKIVYMDLHAHVPVVSRDECLPQMKVHPPNELSRRRRLHSRA